MARKHLPRTDHDAPSAEDARNLGDVGCNSQVQDAPSISHVDIELTRRFGNSVLAGTLEPEWTNNKTPNRNTIPNKLTYITHYALDMAYVTPPWNTETHKKFKRRLYKRLLTLANAERGDQELRVTHKHPTIPWTRVWTPLSA